MEPKRTISLEIEQATAKYLRDKEARKTAARENAAAAEERRRKKAEEADEAARKKAEATAAAADERRRKKAGEGCQAQLNLSWTRQRWSFATLNIACYG